MSKPLGRLIEPIIKPALKKHGLAEARLLLDWEIIVGSAVASVSMPTKLSYPKGKSEGATLYLDVDSPAALEIQHSIPQILERIGSFLGYRAVSKISLRQIRMRRKDVIDSAPTSPAIAQQAQHSVGTMEDDRLRQSLCALGERILMTKR